MAALHLLMIVVFVMVIMLIKTVQEFVLVMQNLIVLESVMEMLKRMSVVNVMVKPPILLNAVSYTHLTLPTILRV